MTMNRDRNIDTFNARFLDYSRVGATYVPTPYLNEVVIAEHTAILGPRGSGKTTLLKMLTTSAIRFWRLNRPDDFLDALSFLSVYVPASITWSAEYRGYSLGDGDKVACDLISVSLFRHSVLIALLETISEARDHRLSEDASLSKFYLNAHGDNETLIARALSRVWNIDPSAGTIQGLRDSISARIRLLQKLSVELPIIGHTPSDLIRDHSFISAHFIDDASQFIDQLKSIFAFDLKVCLCFDELEIAPEPVARSILKAPRSIDQRLLIKFSAAPYVSSAQSQSTPGSPSELNDFRLVFLSSFSAAKVRPFSAALFRSLCEARGIKAGPEDILGLSFLDDYEAVESSDLGPKTRYGASGSRQQKYKSLYKRDPSFRVYADEKDLDVADLSSGTEKRRAAAVRKVLWPVLVREEFLFTQESPGSQRRRLRSKDLVSDIYTGSGSIFALCEGNPRWLIGLLDPIVERVIETGFDSQRSHQKQLIAKMISSYFALLSTVPSKEHAGRIESLVDLVDRVGTYFKESILGEKFNPDPVLSFVVDEGTQPNIRDLIGRGINMGAFVTTQDTQSSVTYSVGEIRGLKIRLTNMLAPHFRIPLTGGRTVNLSTILVRTRATESSALSDLFGERA